MHLVRSICVALVLAGLPTAAHADDVLGNVLNRVYVSGFAGDGWTARYTYDRYRSTRFSGGAAAGLVLGTDNFGLDLSAGLMVDRGTTPDSAMLEPDPLWLLDVGIGIASSPVMYQSPTTEIRLDLRLRGALVFRQGCDAARCDREAGEPTFGLLPVLSGGVLGWFGEDACHGWGIDLVFVRGQVGDMHRTHSTDAELLPPAWLLRFSWLPYRGRRR